MNFKIFTISIVFLIFVSFIPSNFADSQVAVIETTFGNMVIEFFPNDAPKTVANFINLTENGFYDKTKFHRIIPNFMIQGGDPLSKDDSLIQQWGTGSSGNTINAEFNNIKHLRGIVSMARSMNPNSASSQFFIVHKDSTFLDKQYTVFGRLVTQESYDVLDSIASLETNHNATSGMPLDAPLDLNSAEIHSIKIKNLSEIPNTLNPSEPERIISYSAFNEGIYSNTLFGFSFEAPQGWTLQEPQKTQPETPDVVVVGPQNDEFNAVIAFLIENKTGTSLEQHVKDTRTNLQPIIDAGRLQILSEEDTNIDGFNAHVTEAKGGFAARDKIFIIKYKEIVLESDDKFYTITYTNQEKDFDSDLTAFNNVLDSFETSSQPKTESQYTDFSPAVDIGMNNIGIWISVGIGIAIAIGVVVIVIKKKKDIKQKPNPTKPN
ncbi:MAG TPA: peptidylprolyl isomerase [Nitrosopumilaceae archaeon]|nr:peptidylprolyl isomerase [Nitrosopumilaceae archaeon]